MRFRFLSVLLFSSLLLASCSLSKPTANSTNPNHPGSFNPQAPTNSPTPSPTPITLKNNLYLISGSLNLTSNRKTTVIRQNQAISLQVGDVIKTNSNSLAILYFHPISHISIAPNTQVTFLGTDNSITHLHQNSGLIFAHFAKAPKVQEGLALQTPTTLTSNRGASLSQEIIGGTIRLLVFDNSTTISKLDLRTKFPLNSSQFVVNEGQEISFSGSKTNQIKNLKLTSKEQQWLDLNRELNRQFTDNKLPTDKTFLSAFLKYLKSIGAISESTLLDEPSPQVELPPITKLPGAGYTESEVKSPFGNFPLACVGSSKSTTKIITDTGNNEDCKNNCKVLPLSNYVTRNDGFAAINGTDFCPAEYPNCKDKSNSFEFLVFNSRLQHYLNLNQNRQSTLPLAVFFNNGALRFIDRILDWTFDENITGAITGNPLLVKNKHSLLTESADNSKAVNYGLTSLVEGGDLVYLCNLTKASLFESAKIYELLGANNALNIDSGGATALWYEGLYRLGPSRDVPNALIFVKK